MKRYRLTSAADRDLRKIAKYTLKLWGVKQREAYISELFDAFERLSTSPEIAVSIDVIRKGYKKFPQASHVIFFRLDNHRGIEIIRVLHKRMDIELHI